MDVWSVLGVLIVVVIAAWGVKLLKNRMEEQRFQQELADMQFEETLLTSYSSSPVHENDSRFQNHLLNEETTYAAAVSVPAIEAKMPPSGELKINKADSPLPADKAAVHVMRQLEQAGLLGEVEGYVDLHGNDKGAAIIRLRNGKRAILVPHMESESFLRRHAKRVDMIIMTGVDEKAVVVTPLEELIAQNLFPGR